MEMSKIESLKAQAENLKAGLAAEGIEISKGKALEMIARQYGFENWDTLCAVVIQAEKAKSEPTLADLGYVPMRAWVEQGPRTESYNIQLFEQGVLALLPDEQALTEFLAKYPGEFEKGLDSDALYLFGPKVIAGKTHWALADGDTFIRFDEEPVLAEKFELTIPKVTRSIKGTELIALRSHDGSFYDHFVMVPPHLDVKTLCTKISEGLTALKERDAADGDSDTEFTETDVKALVERLGCLWVAEPHEVGQNWDN
jgi:hypothetical protein